MQARWVFKIALIRLLPGYLSRLSLAYCASLPRDLRKKMDGQLDWQQQAPKDALRGIHWIHFGSLALSDDSSLLISLDPLISSHPATTQPHPIPSHPILYTVQRHFCFQPTVYPLLFPPISWTILCNTIPFYPLLYSKLSNPRAIPSSHHFHPNPVSFKPIWEVQF